MSTTTGFDLSALTAFVNETKFGNEWYSEPLFDNNTFLVADQNSTVLTGAKRNDYKLPTLESTATLKDGSECGFTPTDQSTIDQTDLHMVPITVQGQFCVRELEDFFTAEGLPPGQHYTQFNPLEAQMLARIQEELARKMALLPYYGPTGSDTVTYNNGWIDLLLPQTGINLGTGNSTNGGTAGTDAAGAWNRVEAIKNRFLSNADSAAGVFQDGEYSVEMSPLDASLYFENMRTLFGQDTVTPLQQRFNDGNFSSWIHPGTRMRIYVVNSLGSGREILGVRRRNKVLAFDLRSDATRLEMGMDQYREYIWWKQRVKIGTAYRSFNAKDVAYYGAAS